MARYYKKFILFIIPLLVIFISYDVNAATLTSYSSNYDACSASNRFTFTNIDTMGNWNYFTGTIGSVISNVPNSMQFDFKYDLSAMKYYDVIFTMTGYDIYSSVNSSMVSISNGSSCGDLSNNNVALVSFTKSSSSNSRYKVMTFRIYSATAVSNWSILLENTSAIAGPENFGVSSITINEVDVSNTDAIINNQNSNTDSVINNQNNNTNSIIDNQNKNNEDLKDAITENQDKNTQDIIDSNKENFKSCYTNIFDASSYTSNTFSSVSINNNDITTTASSSWKTLTYNFDVEIGTEYTLYYEGDDSIGVYYYNGSGSNDFTRLLNSTFTIVIPETNTLTIRLQNRVAGTTTFKNLLLVKGVSSVFIPYGNEVCTNKLDDVNSGLNDINGSINNSDVDNDVGTGFFDNFNNEDFGLSEIITIPLNTISSLTSKTCQPLSIPIPKTSRNINLPCMTQVYQQNMPSIFTIWQVVSFGIIAYFIAVDIFHLVKGFKDPDSDKVEVLDL